MSTSDPITFKRKILYLVFILLIVFIGLQFIRPEIKNPAVTGDLEAPAEVKNILKRACYDCHSNETELKWFDQVVPVSWRVAEHIKEGRAGLNFSNWKNMAKPDQKAKLWEAVNQIAEGAMPLKDYELVHPSAKISENDLSVLKKYVASMAVNQVPEDTAKINAVKKQYQLLYKVNTDKKMSSDMATAKVVAAKTDLPQTVNGITYIPDYKNWQAISTTERFDNGTMRVIFGNPIAIKAIKENNINPWPNGTIFAKVAWDQLQDKDGTIHTGAFKQVEYMIKDDKKYAGTAGWGWARFKTPKLIPYGKNVLFTQECINCHQPVSGQDFVFTPPIKH